MAWATGVALGTVAPGHGGGLGYGNGLGHGWREATVAGWDQGRRITVVAG